MREKADDILLNNSKSVRELWINSHKKGPTTVINSHHGTTTSRPVSLVPSAMAHLEPIIESDLKRHEDGAMHIRELLLKTKGATILEPADPPPPPPQPIENTNNQLVIQVNKNPLDPQKMQLTLPNVSLILTTSASTTSTPENLWQIEVPSTYERRAKLLVLSSAPAAAPCGRQTPTHGQLRVVVQSPAGGAARGRGGGALQDAAPGRRGGRPRRAGVGGLRLRAAARSPGGGARL